MRTEHIFVTWSCIRINDEASSHKNRFNSTSSFSTDYSKAVSLLQFFFVCANVISYMTFFFFFFFFFFTFLLPILPSLVPREGCASSLWHLLGIYTYIFAKKGAIIYNEQKH